MGRFKSTYHHHYSQFGLIFKQNKTLQVNSIRAAEIGALKKAAYLNAVMTFLWVCAPVVVALASFATYVLVISGLLKCSVRIKIK